MTRLTRLWPKLPPLLADAAAPLDPDLPAEALACSSRQPVAQAAVTGLLSARLARHCNLSPKMVENLMLTPKVQTNGSGLP